jgi:hypothetical protein
MTKRNALVGATCALLVVGLVELSAIGAAQVPATGAARKHEVRFSCRAPEDQTQPSLSCSGKPFGRFQNRIDTSRFPKVTFSLIKLKGGAKVKLTARLKLKTTSKGRSINGPWRAVSGTKGYGGISGDGTMGGSLGPGSRLTWKGSVRY